MMGALPYEARAPVLAIAAAVALVLAVPAAGLAVATPHWVAISQQAPREFHPGDTRDFYEVIAVNDGTATTSGPITITDTLPPGIVVNAKAAFAEIPGIQEIENTGVGCEQAGNAGVVTVTCTTEAGVPVGRALVVNINVEVPPVGTLGTTIANAATIAGGGAALGASTGTTAQITDPSVRVPFGASFVSDITDANGEVDTQAGSHPFSFSTLVAFNAAGVNANESCNQFTTLSCAVLNAQAKDIEVALPPGLVGNPTAVPYCTQAQFEQKTFLGCPASSQVGGLYLYFYGGGTAIQYAPVYNIKPPPGQPAELGFSVSTAAHIPLFFHVRSDGDYGLTANIFDINQFDAVRVALLSIWGVPSDEAHNAQRLSVFGNCDQGSGGCPSGAASPKPFLSMPTGCTGGSFSIPLSGDSWQHPEPSPYALLASASMPAMTDCSALTFNPTITVGADTHQAGAAAGYKVDVSVPQNEDIEGLATPALRNAEVTLPEGTTISPSAANGLSSCSDAEFGLKVRAKGHCPSASRIGSVTITTPLLAAPLEGNVYVGSSECQPCSPADAEGGRMVRIFFEAEAEGVLVKQAGHTRIDQNTGRLTTVFTEAPQAPVSDIQISLEPDPNAPLINPSTCGPAVTQAHLTPWSASTATNIGSPPIQIDGCGTQRFAPAFEAGMTQTSHAGSFSGFSMTLARGEGEQTLGKVSVTTPPGLLGVLKSVQQCAEPQANAGTCGEGSLIGSGSIVVGPGSSPLTITGSKVYLTGPYAGKPFGLSIVTPAVAGPFVLAGNASNGTEVVRASIVIDQHTGALTVKSDSLPQALNGVPLDIRTVQVDVNRTGFTFNPTNCDAMFVGAILTSAGGTTSTSSSPFQATGCASLPFKPKFTVSTQGKTSKKNGASLRVKVTSGPGQANIGKVKVNLPIQLPSRLTTLQKACVDKVFDANPASCAAVSIVGKATAVTPLLKNPLTGPAYLVSHAGASFPDLEIVLQGEGITLILDGNTDIKKGITSSTFRAVPDAPISTFDLSLPEGPHSVLAAFGSLCTGKLKMPTVITGQNGGVVRQTTKITATGCPKYKHVKARRATKRKG
jgi:hypothetical protein